MSGASTGRPLTRSLITLGWKLLCFSSLPLLYVLPLNHGALWPLAYFCFVPFLLAVLHQPRRYDPYLAAVALWVTVVTGVRWLSTFGTLALLLTPAFYFVPFYFLAPLVRRTHQRLGLPLLVVFPLFLTAGEWLRVRISPGELALLLVGYTQVSLTRLVQIADITGVAGVTFFVAAWNGWLADLALAALGGRASLRERRRGLGAGLAGLAVLTLALLGYGTWRDDPAHEGPGPRVAIVQPNVPHFPPRRQAENRRSYDLQVLYTLSRVPRGSADVVLWPENSLLDLFDNRGTYAADYMADLRALTRGFDAPLLLDAAELPAGSDGWTHHTAYLVSRDGEVSGKSRKVYLLPWTEYVPFASALDWVFLGRPFRGLIRSVVGFMPDGRPGRVEDINVFPVPWAGGTTAFGVPICFEAATPGVTNAMVRKGARFLVNITSEGLLGPTVYRQTLIINAFRAIETRAPVVRATNNGISAILDGNGRVRRLVRGERTGALYGEEGALIDMVPLDARAGSTFYVRHGDVFAYAVLGLTGLVLVAGRARARRIPAADRRS